MIFSNSNAYDILLEIMEAILVLGFWFSCNIKNIVFFTMI